jgi:hypothetical protein
VARAGCAWPGATSGGQRHDVAEERSRITIPR